MKEAEKTKETEKTKVVRGELREVKLMVGVPTTNTEDQTTIIQDKF